MKSLIFVLLWSVFSAQAGLMPFGCSIGGLCGKPVDKNNAPATPTPAQKLNPLPNNASNSNNNTAYTNSTNPSQSGTQGPRPEPTLPNLNPPPKGFTPPKQN